MASNPSGNPSSNEVQVGAQGRLVIPAALRKALGLKPGDRLIARQEGESLVLERREAIGKRLQDRFRHIPKEVSYRAHSDIACRLPFNAAHQPRCLR